MNKVGGILLDTCQYGIAPGLLTVNAGLHGEILEDQFEVVEQWIRDDAEPFDYTWVLFGHHPVGTLRSGAQRGLSRLRKADHIPLFVSAHTHKGNFRVHGSGADAMAELNIGSVLDWPMVYQTLYLGLGEDNHAYIRTRRWSAATETRLQPNDDWLVTFGEPDYYLLHSYARSISSRETEEELKNALLATHRRMLENFSADECAKPDPEYWPSDPRTCEKIERHIDLLPVLDYAIEHACLAMKIEFLLELERFEAQRLKKSSEGDCPEYREFRLAQAIWASKYDSGFIGTDSAIIVEIPRKQD